MREALSLAINREAIVDRVMEGAAVPSGEFLAPGTTATCRICRPPFDPSGRAAAGGGGVSQRVAHHVARANDRYVNDAKIIQAVGQMWSRVGVRTTVDALPWNELHRAREPPGVFGVPAWLGKCHRRGVEPAARAGGDLDAAKGYGAANCGRYVNPALDALLGQALRTADDAAREQKMEQATRMAMDDVALIPLHMQKNIWAMRAGLRYTARADEETRAWDLRTRALGSRGVSRSRPRLPPTRIASLGSCPRTAVTGRRMAASRVPRPRCIRCTASGACSRPRSGGGCSRARRSMLAPRPDAVPAAGARAAWRWRANCPVRRGWARWRG